jgi:hypothetical protein
VAGRCNDEEFVLQPGPNDQLRVRLRALDEAHVDLEGHHRIDHLAGVADHHPHRAGRVGLLPSAQQLGQQVLADGQARRHAQRRLMLVREQVLHLRGPIQQRCRRGQQRQAVLVQQQTAPDTIEQLRAQGALKVRKACAGSRLRPGHVGCARACRAGAGGGDEDLQLPQAQAQPGRGLVACLLICFSVHHESNYRIFFRDRH